MVGLVVAVLLTAAACAGQSNKAGIERLHKVVAAAGPTAATEQETVS